MKQFFKGNEWLLFATITFSLLANIALVLTSKQSEWLFDALSAKDAAKFTQIVVLAICYIFIIGGLFYIYLVCSKKLIKKVLARLREKSFSGIMKKDMKTYYQQNTSEYISVLTNDINLLEENWMKPMLGGLREHRNVRDHTSNACLLQPLDYADDFRNFGIGIFSPQCFGQISFKATAGLVQGAGSIYEQSEKYFFGL